MVRTGSSAEGDKGACVQAAQGDWLGTGRAWAPSAGHRGWSALPEMLWPENGPPWSSVSWFREISGHRWGVTEPEADIFHNLDPDTHIRNGNCRLAVIRGRKVCDLTDGEQDQQRPCRPMVRRHHRPGGGSVLPCMQLSSPCCRLPLEQEAQMRVQPKTYVLNYLCILGRWGKCELWPLRAVEPE